MVSETATGFLRRRLGDAFRFYRLFFNAVAILLLVPLVWYTRSITEEPFLRGDGPWLAVRYALVALGIFLFLAGGRHYRLRQFLGLSQLRGTSPGGLAASGGIDSSGVLGVIRHPWYSGLVLLLWARDLDGARLVANGVLTVYIVVGTLLEERAVTSSATPTAATSSGCRCSSPRWLRSRVRG
jgi:hypothetical protein